MSPKRSLDESSNIGDSGDETISEVGDTPISEYEDSETRSPKRARSASSSSIGSPPGLTYSPGYSTDAESVHGDEGATFKIHVDSVHPDNSPTPPGSPQNGPNTRTSQDDEQIENAGMARPTWDNPESLVLDFLGNLKTWMNDRSAQLRTRLDQAEKQLVDRRSKAEFSKFRDKAEQWERKYRDRVAAARTEEFLAAHKNHVEAARSNQTDAGNARPALAELPVESVSSVKPGAGRNAEPPAHDPIAYVKEWQTKWNNIPKDIEYLSKLFQKNSTYQNKTKELIDMIRKDLEDRAWNTTLDPYLNDFAAHNTYTKIIDREYFSEKNTNIDSNIDLVKLNNEIIEYYNNFVKSHPELNEWAIGSVNNYEYLDNINKMAGTTNVALSKASSSAHISEPDRTEQSTPQGRNLPDRVRDPRGL